MARQSSAKAPTAVRIRSGPQKQKALENSLAFFIRIFMRYSNYFGIAAGILMICAALFPWIYIPSLNTSVTGFGSDTVTKFGKPILMNIYVFVLNVIFFLLPKVWAKKMNTLFGAVNFAWALRNLLLLSTCRNGECPEKQVWLYIYVAAAFVLLLMAVLPDINVDKENK